MYFRHGDAPLYAYVASRPTSYRDPLGLFVVIDQIDVLYDAVNDPYWTAGPRLEIDYSCRCSGSTWNASFRLNVTGTIHFRRKTSDCTRRHEFRHASIYEGWIQQTADPVLSPVERMPYGSQDDCKRAAERAKQAAFERMRANKWKVPLAETGWDVKDFFNCLW